ncbi:hypothetical protein HRbin32_02024 [bacterium HR32]|nr:hypothetical protein HRbin32_02024 [bacterium HR32]
MGGAVVVAEGGGVAGACGASVEAGGALEGQQRTLMNLLFLQG